MDFEERFWSKVDASGPCWLWTASINEGGYGRYCVSKVGRRSMLAYAHRHSWTIMVGEIPQGMQLDHLCKVRNCVNPDHLEVVAPKVNARRARGTGVHNKTKTHCPSGHEYNEENTIVQVRGTWTMRSCRTCKLAKGRR